MLQLFSFLKSRKKDKELSVIPTELIVVSTEVKTTSRGLEDSPNEGEFFFHKEKGCFIYYEGEWRQPKAYDCIEQTNITDPILGLILVQKTEQLLRLVDEPVSFSSGLFTVDERHLFASNKFKPVF